MMSRRDVVVNAGILQPIGVEIFMLGAKNFVFLRGLDENLSGSPYFGLLS